VTPGPDARPPLVAVTRGDPRAADPERSATITEAYVAAIARSGGETVVLTPSMAPAAREQALAAMDGLLLSGGADLSPALYARAPAGTREVDAARDALELEAWRIAAERDLPVLGICRGLQAINVFSGGGLSQHVDGHEEADGTAVRHGIRVVGGTQLARILRPTNPGAFVLRVNSAHHQAVRAEDLAPGLLASAWAQAGEQGVVEALEGRDPGRLVLGVQCHPERTASSPPEFERLFRFFVDAAAHARRAASSPA
jgi:putative glutamine amidotransferase